MPATPQTWLNQFIVNLTTTGSQSDPDIIQLANGNILVCWTSTDDTGAGSATGTDVIGQIFDPVGNLVGSEFRINTFGNANNEQNMDMAATPDGGFIAVYERVVIGTGVTTICIDRFNSSGVQTGGSFIVDDSANTDPNFLNPQVAVSGSTSALVVYEQTSGTGTTIVGKIYNPSTNAVGSQFNLIAFAGGDTDPDVTALTNGNYVITATHNQSGDNRIIYRIVDSTGANVLAVTAVGGTGGNGFNDREATVTALTGGGFVIAWTNTDSNDTDILFKVYNAAGTEVGSGFPFDTGATNNNNEAKVIALADGTFVIACDNDATFGVDVQHFSATGVALGSVFTVSTDNADNISGTTLGDGRVALVWDVSGGEVSMEILDTRDNVNNPGVYTPDQWQIGTVGNDVFTADASSEFVHGHDGNDVITEAGQIRQYFGDAGDDTLLVNSSINSDVHNGGAGTDTIDWSGDTFNTGGIIFNLALGTATESAADGGQVEQMVGFENLNGTNNSDTIIGTDGVNILNGNDGNDTIKGGGGKDFINGGGGNDILTGGGGGKDKMTGGAGNDTFFVNKAGEAIEGVNQGTDTVNATVSYTLGANIEKLVLLGGGNLIGKGNILDNTITGNSGDNILSGGGGNDLLTGGLGRDTMNGGLGNDRFDFNATADSGITGATRDKLVAFDAGTNVTTVDRIDLSTIDAIAGGTNQAFTFGGAFTAGHLQVVQSGSSVLIRLNTDADAAAEMVIEVTNANAGDFNASDFIL